MAAPHSGFLVQVPSDELGNFEMVVPTPSGGLVHCWRDNTVGNLPWSEPNFFGSGFASGTSLIYSSFGHLELVAVADGQLVHYWRDTKPPFPWYGPFPIGSGVSGNPALLQGTFGALGNFEVVVPLASGGLAHWGRDNDTPDLVWNGPTIFGTSAGKIDAVAMIQSNFGNPGHLEVVARAGTKLVHFWRESAPPFAWFGPFPIPLEGLPATITPFGRMALIQGNHGNAGNFELVTPLSSGGMAHLGRFNDLPDLPWTPVNTFGTFTVNAVAMIQSTFGTPGLGSLDLVAQSGPQVYHFWRQDFWPFIWHGPTVTVFQEPPANPAEIGEWQIPYSVPAVGVHAALLHTGKVLFWSYESDDPHHHGPNDPGDDDHGHDPGDRLQFSEVAVFDPVTGKATTPVPEKNLFCGGQTIMGDGRVLVAGGSINGVQSLHLFTPTANGGSWQDAGLMIGGDRWYATCTSLPDGRVAIMSGSKEGGGPTISAYTCQLEKPVNATFELYDPLTGNQTLHPAPMFVGDNLYNLYPWNFVLPDGRLFVHFHNRSFLLNLATNQWDDIILTTVSPHGRTYPAQGTAVLLPLRPQEDYTARIMIMGGAGVSCPLPSSADLPADPSCEIIDLSQPEPAWQSAAPLPIGRVMPDSVLLPNGTVLVVNGSSTGVADNGLHPVFSADLYDPVTNTWTPLHHLRVPRLYHSTALLLPDGRVMTAGKDRDNNPLPFKWSEYRVEIFSPPYLFRGPRPVILTAPATLDYGATFKVKSTTPAAITSAVLIRPGAVTHSFNHNQRLIELEITGRTSQQLTLTAPPNAFVAPPGYYMLFLVTAAGVPSVAKFVHID